jgi:hypothetical protein
MGITHEETEDGESVGFIPNHPRPWLVAHPVHKEELSFDPDRFASTLDYCSKGDRFCRLFLLHVWNHHYAQAQGWEFDLFAAVNRLDSGNLEFIAAAIRTPIWP